MQSYLQSVALFVANTTQVGMYELICGRKFVKISHSDELIDMMIENVSYVLEFKNSNFTGRRIFPVDFVQNSQIVGNGGGSWTDHPNTLKRNLTFVICYFGIKLQSSNKLVLYLI